MYTMYTGETIDYCSNTELANSMPDQVMAPSTGELSPDDSFGERIPLSLARLH